MAIPIENPIPDDYFEVDFKLVVAAVAELQAIVAQLTIPDPG